MNQIDDYVVDTSLSEIQARLTANLMRASDAGSDIDDDILATLEVLVEVADHLFDRIERLEAKLNIERVTDLDTEDEQWATK